MSGSTATPAAAPAIAPARTLSARLKELKLPQGRLKTGTPPRLDGRTIDYARLVEQPGRRRRAAVRGRRLPVFSFLGDPRQHPRQVSCWITQTNARTHDIIRAGFDAQPDVHRPDRRRRPALLPEHRGQGQPLRRTRTRTRSFSSPKDWRRTRSIRTASRRRCRFDVQIEAVRSIAGLEAGAHRAAGLRDRVRLLRPPGAAAELRDAGDRAACSSPGRSTARPATKRRRRKGCMPA